MDEGSEVGRSGSGESQCTLASSQTEVVPAERVEGEGTILLERDLLVRRRLVVVREFFDEGDRDACGWLGLAFRTIVVGAAELGLVVRISTILTLSSGLRPCLA